MSAKNKILILFCLGIFFGLFRLPAPAFADTPDFCTGFQFNGNAKPFSTCEIQLTQNIGWNAGSAWSVGTANLAANFDVTVQMYFGVNNPGADGITFVLQNDPRGRTAIGSLGADLGYAGGGAIVKSVGVEFDTYRNWSGELPDHNDPVGDHIMIVENGNNNHTGTCGTTPYGGTVVTASGTCPVQASAGGPNIKDGAYHTVRFVWTTATSVLQVYFDGSLRLTYTNTNLIASLGTSTPYVGFT
jgi:hypothetical protein